MEGVIQFSAVCESGDVPGAASDLCCEVGPMREHLIRLGWVGARPDRYAGLGFGNLSVRDDSAGFYVTASQIGGELPLRPDHWCLVLSVDAENNRVRYQGKRPPSSESMTHAAVYEAHPDAACVVHVHAPEVWQQRHALPYPQTSEAITYGTPGMYEETLRLVPQARDGVLVLGGHEDGLLIWGATVDEAYSRLLRLQEQALRQEGVHG
ncbi:MAG: class II aldolase/adducin family protein [Gammaproteobacteria bacterium]|nr:MAG: class II aldolase/adducin family protein [Gammaproteobacteria bacterium]